MAKEASAAFKSGIPEPVELAKAAEKQFGVIAETQKEIFDTLAKMNQHWMERAAAEAPMPARKWQHCGDLRSIMQGLCCLAGEKGRGIRSVWHVQTRQTLGGQFPTKRYTSWRARHFASRQEVFEGTYPGFTRQGRDFQVVSSAAKQPLDRSSNRCCRA